MAVCHLVSEVVAEAAVEVLTSDRTWPQRSVKLPAKGECVRVSICPHQNHQALTYMYLPKKEGSAA